jgi:hypothetical protein
LDRIAPALGFRRREDLESWVRSARGLAYELQNIAPAEAHDGPNPEYPWPHDAPAHCPADEGFALWSRLKDTGQGRKLMEFVERAIACFDQYS